MCTGTHPEPAANFLNLGSLQGRHLITGVRIHLHAVAATVRGVRHRLMNLAVIFRRRRGRAPRAVAAGRPPFSRQSLAVVRLDQLAARLVPVDAGLARDHARPCAIPQGRAVAAAIGGLHLGPMHQVKLVLTGRGRVPPAGGARQRERRPIGARPAVGRQVSLYRSRARAGRSTCC